MGRSVIFYGAFDRYNYGDNLMPLLLAEYLKDSNPTLTDANFVFSSISNSDLSRYLCKPTVAMKDLLNVDEGSSVIIVGGEVLGADIGVLYTHVQTSHFKVQCIRFMRRIVPGFINRIARNAYGSVWDFPYIPEKKSFKNKVNIIFNTVGGIPVKSQEINIKHSDYISVRDNRTYEVISKFAKAKLVPDSVLMASGVIDLEFVESKVRSELITRYASKKYITIQACPYKVDFTPDELAKELSKFDTEYDVVLLPIGYASGHDDVMFLNKVNLVSGNKYFLEDDLNVWEIMYLIIKSQAFYGTSLHGVITAMSFRVPHYCINKNIAKLTSFLDTWSVSPYNKPIHISEISSTLENSHASIDDLDKAVIKAQSIIFESISDFSKIL
ncbi:polysaccharide pyruvyl transferase family protein [Enterobacter sp. JUb54]|uniref:polysaccharide pyruvyl transferase family protein n=1 Tax=Enterobacteriaceae TaxID=543 RepID=UPI00164E26A2|nr:polysaccharide pyruvyl transferase family protein [Enterobacter sp. JUb54]QNK08296.1 polysaccharide pyruvyl transferase family protein [Enterobacter sp. JUb54]